MPQYDGSLVYEVKSEAGFEHLSFSKSQNEIRAHTEAPGWDPPPRYLALWCHVQAETGGETCLADVNDYLRRPDPGVVERLCSTDIRWAGSNTSGTGSSGVVAPILGADSSGREMLRFSYNLLSSGHYDPPLGAEVPVDELPLGKPGLDLARQVDEFFQNSAIRVRIPEGGVLLWDNQRMAHARVAYTDARRHLSRYWITDA
jgi:hypothetical protein